VSALDPSAPGLPLAGGGGGGASLPVADFSDVLAGATASRIAATDASGNGTLLTAAQALAALGLGATLDPSTGTITDSGATGTASASAFAVAIANGVADGSASRVSITRPSSLGRGFDLRARVTNTGTSAGARVAQVAAVLASGQAVWLEEDDGGGWNCRYGSASTLTGTSMGNGTASPVGGSLWFTLRIDGGRVLLWTGTSATASPPTTWVLRIDSTGASGTLIGTSISTIDIKVFTGGASTGAMTTTVDSLDLGALGALTP